MAETLYIVDTFSLIFQVFHAIRQPMTGSRGQPTNAIYGFTGDLKHIIEQLQPTHLICAVDSPGPGTRNDIFPEYKANRSETPEDLAPQIPQIIELIEAHEIPAIQQAGWEADDVIATLTRQAVERGMEVRIISSDKDLRQLLGPQVQIYQIRKKTYLDEEYLQKDWGIRADQVIDFQSLVGDSVDNVPGVPLVGPKKASALLEKFGTLDDILANPQDAPGKKLQENLVTFADQARMSKELVTLNQQLPIEIDWETAKVKEPNTERLLELFTDYGFRRYSDELRQRQKGGNSAPEKKERTWTTIRSKTEFNKFLKELKKQKRYCVDLETTSLNAVEADIVGWAFSWEASTGFYIPVDGPPGESLVDAPSVAEALKPILESTDVEVVNQNIKYDMLVLRRIGIRVAKVGLDPMIGDYLLDAGARGHGLDKLARDYLAHEMIPISDLIGKGKRQKKMFEVDVDKAAEYASEDADITWQVAEIVEQRLKSEKLWDLYWDLERPLITVLTDMEFQGIRVNIDELKQQSDELELRLRTLITDIYTEVGHEFNIDSPKQLSVVLFDELGLPVIKKTKTGNSTNAEVLEQLALQHPLPAQIVEYRQLRKLKNTYLDALPEMVSKTSGNIHASFNQVVAATGRLSSSDPNLQNIPVRTEEGRRIRRAFIPSEENWSLVCADYSQVELRMLAHFCQDPALMDAFQTGIDIHTAVAAQVFGENEEDVTSEMRRMAKAVNFGVIYGQSSFGLAATLGISRDEAARFIDDYFHKYAKVEQYMEQLLDDCDASGYAYTLLGRRRAISGIRKPRPKQRNLSERTAINTVIQGSAADLIKQAMINLHKRLIEEDSPARLLLQIHDELILETPTDQVEETAQMVRSEMESALDLAVPIVVDVKAGPNWLDAEPI